MNTMKRLRLMTIACILFALPVFFCGSAGAATLKTTLIANDSVACYEDSAATVSAGQLSFGDTIVYSSKGKTVTKVKVSCTDGCGLNGKYAYVPSQDLTVSGDSPNFQYPLVYETSATQKAYKKGSTSSTKLGYVLRGTGMEVLGEYRKTSKSTIFLKVRIPKTYTASSGKKVKKTNITAYVKKSYTTEAYNYMKARQIAPIYTSVASSDPAGYLDMGDRVQALVSQIDGDWWKVKFNGKVCYVSSSALGPLQQLVTVKSVSVRKTTSSSSALQATVYWNTPITLLYSQTISGKTYHYAQCSSGEGWFQSSGKIGYTTTAYATESTLLYASSDFSNSDAIAVPAKSKVFVECLNRVPSGIVKVTAKIDGVTEEGYVDASTLTYDSVSVCGKVFANAYNCTKNSNEVGILDNEDALILASNKSAGFSYIAYPENGDYSYYWIRNASIVPDFPQPDLPDDPNVMFIADNSQRVYHTEKTDGSYDVLRYLDPVIFISVKGSYVKIKVNGNIRYIYCKDASTKGFDSKLLKEYPKYGNEAPNNAAPLNKMQQEILRWAFDFLYNKKTTYVSSQYGTVNSNGYYQFDCSNFVAYIINHAMGSVSGTTWNVPTACDSATGNRNINDAAYCDSNKKYPAKVIWQKGNAEAWGKNVQIGDVMMFYGSDSDKNKKRTITHVGLYVGNGDIIHCTRGCSGADKVIISHVDATTGGLSSNAGDSKLVKIKRFIPDNVDLLK